MPALSARPIIGVIGGMGPHAGLLLARRVFDLTIAERDQQHVPLAMLSFSDQIPDRTGFLSGNQHGTDTPAAGINDVADRLMSAGATVLGMPCNTAHAPAILDPVLDHIGDRASFLHLIDETAAFAKELVPGIERAGLLATLGTYRTKTYDRSLTRAGIQCLVPENTDLVHRSLYDPAFGIKAHPAPVREEAVRLLETAAERLADAGAQAVILGCTELPLAVQTATLGGLPVIDSVTALARALLRSSYPERLRS